jgi:hypothetical protein
MTRSNQSIAKLAIAIGLIGTLAVGVATPSFARSAAASAGTHYYEPGSNGSVWSFYPGYTDESTAQRTVDGTSALSAHAEVRGLNHAAARVDNPPGSAFQTQGNNDSMGCPC